MVASEPTQTRVQVSLLLKAACVEGFLCGFTLDVAALIVCFVLSVNHSLLTDFRVCDHNNGLKVILDCAN